MSAVTYSGWDKYRTTCEEALEEACQLWVKSESLVVEVAETEIGSDKSDLLEACKELLEACDCRIAAEEEILELNDLRAQSYILAPKHTRVIGSFGNNKLNSVIYFSCPHKIIYQLLPIVSESFWP